MLTISDPRCYNLINVNQITPACAVESVERIERSETSNEIFNQFQNTAETPGAEPYEKSETSLTSRKVPKYKDLVYWKHQTSNLSSEGACVLKTQDTSERVCGFRNTRKYKTL